MTTPKISIGGAMAALWGAFGVVAILVFAVVRLAPIAAEAIDAGLTVTQWIVLGLNVVFMAWSEGYKGFQLRFSPRVAARTLFLARHPAPVAAMFAPLYCIGYFDASRRGLTAAWIGTLAIVLLVILVHELEQPWRGILDAGVVVGLSWGTLSLVASLLTTFKTGRYARSPELGERSAPLALEPGSA